MTLRFSLVSTTSLIMTLTVESQIPATRNIRGSRRLSLWQSTPCIMRELDALVNSVVLNAVASRLRDWLDQHGKVGRRSDIYETYVLRARYVERKDTRLGRRFPETSFQMAAISTCTQLEFHIEPFNAATDASTVHLEAQSKVSSSQ